MDKNNKSAQQEQHEQQKDESKVKLLIEVLHDDLTAPVELVALKDANSEKTRETE